MSEFLKTRDKTKVLDTNKFEKFLKLTNNRKSSLNITVVDVAVLIFSCFSVLSDLFTDLILVAQYSYQGYKEWAVVTFILIFFPSLIVQFFSIRWHIIDNSTSVIHWVFHFCMLGILHRYYLIIKSALTALNSKNESDIHKVYIDQSNLCLLHLFESFLESSPQLVLQVYVTAVLNELRFWTVFSAVASLLSLAWALAAYTKTQRQAMTYKNSSSWLGLLFQAIWRTGMLTARITTLVLGIFCFREYIFLLVFLHWFAMTIWIIIQKTDFCESYWEERIYNCVVGAIYCFCFFNLQEGTSRWRMLSFYAVIISQNLTCLVIFLVKFGETSPKLAVFSFFSIIGGTLLGISSLFLYYRYFHPSGPIKFSFSLGKIGGNSSSGQNSTMTLRSLKQMRSDSQSGNLTKSPAESNSKKLLASPISDSIIIIEEAHTHSDSDLETLRNWLNDVDQKNDKFIKTKNTSVENICRLTNEGNSNLDALKRRAICSEADLVKLIEINEIEINHSSIVPDDDFKLKEIEKSSSENESLSMHDYENLCNVNVKREKWGLRSWKGYTDIETRIHDDSVVNESKSTMPKSLSTVSDKSFESDEKVGEFTQNDCQDAADNDSEEALGDIIDECAVNSLPITYPLSTLDTIIEETDDLTPRKEATKTKASSSTFSCLVATIEEISKSTPTVNRCRKFHSNLSPLHAPRKPILCSEKVLNFAENSKVPWSSSQENPNVKLNKMPLKETQIFVNSLHREKEKLFASDFRETLTNTTEIGQDENMPPASI